MVYKLRLLNLQCHLSDESDGDEIFIMLNGEKVWPGAHKYQNVKEKITKLDISLEVNKGDRLEFELWDYDTLSPNDKLGIMVVEANSHGSFVSDFIKTGADSSKYALEWELG